MGRIPQDVWFCGGLLAIVGGVAMKSVADALILGGGIMVLIGLLLSVVSYLNKK